MKDELKNKNITVSIIIPVYNVQDYLNRCIISILSQTLENYEIIIIDDGSTDNSGKIISMSDYVAHCSYLEQSYIAEYVYDIQLTLANGDIFTVIPLSHIVICEEVTQ